MKDTTGAGDAVAAGFIFALLNGAELNECIDKAFVFGSLASTEIGARTAFGLTSPGQKRSVVSPKVE
ncbi:MAG: PfkB family carbohydrate kinase [Janthinobacterium lividum]